MVGGASSSLSLSITRSHMVLSGGIRESRVSKERRKERERVEDRESSKELGQKPLGECAASY